MKKIIVILQQVLSETFSDSELPAGDSQFQCDGRTLCSQMTSCEEATFFVRNCPDVKMDGDRDGVACESQWCD